MIITTSKILAISFLFFFFLMVNSSKLNSRGDNPACSDEGVDRQNCDESKNKNGANKCSKNEDCASGRFCNRKNKTCKNN